MYKGFPQQNGQVYYDAKKGQYYTINGSSALSAFPSLNNAGGTRVYIGNPIQQQQLVSPVNDLIAKAAAAQANAPTLASLFPSMGQGLLGGFNVMPSAYTGQWGAGRFLAPNVSQFGNTAQPMSGFAPNVTANTK